jgi:acyl-coenzyme A thioesterase PaaI-like protein
MMSMSDKPAAEEGAHALGPAHHQLAENVRQLITAVATTEETDQALARAARLVREATSIIDTLSSVEDHRLATESGLRPIVNPFDSPTNPLAPPLQTSSRQEPGEYSAEVTLSPAYAGPPGRVHGGVVTGILDHASGFAVATLGVVAMSVSLEINLHDATPYGEPLVVSARVADHDGRKIWVEATLATAGGHITASAKTLLITPLAVPSWAAPDQGGIAVGPVVSER